MGLFFYLVVCFVAFFVPCSRACAVTEVRLIGQVDRPNSGIVEVYRPDVGWGVICNENATWNYQIGQRVCEALNFPGMALVHSPIELDDDCSSQARRAIWSALVMRDNDPQHSPYIFTCEGGAKRRKSIFCDVISYSLDTDNQYPIEDVLAVTCKEPGYLGCFSSGATWANASGESESPHNLLFSDRPHRPSAGLTAEACIKRCRSRGFKYAGLWAGHDCVCGEASENVTMSNTTKLGDNYCYDICSGDDKDSCGSKNALSVYDVELGFCKDPGTPRRRGSRKGDWFRYGSTVSFSCPKGSKLNGAPTVQCLHRRPTGDLVQIRGKGSPHSVAWNATVPRKCVRDVKRTDTLRMRNETEIPV